jgi:hypothetical protein
MSADDIEFDMQDNDGSFFGFPVSSGQQFCPLFKAGAVNNV